MNKATSRHNKQTKELLGKEFGRANKDLHRMFLFNLLKEDNENVCFRCGQIIENFKDFSIDHKEDWRPCNSREFKPELFLDVNNILFAHIRCNAGSANAGKGSSKYVGVRLFHDKKKNYKKWVAYRGNKTKFDYFGYHEDEKMAAHARDLGIIRFYDGIGLINFPGLKNLYNTIIEEGWGKSTDSKRIDYKSHYSYFNQEIR